MTNSNEKIFAALRYISAARKSFDTKPNWKTIENNRFSFIHQVIIPIRLDGILRDGVQIRILTPAKVWEEDVYGQLEMRLPGVRRSLRLNAVEWRPLRPHGNPADGPAAHRRETLFDRWYPFEINAQHGMQAFDQNGAGIAVPLPREPTNFSEYANLCADLWVCPDMYDLPPPPWARTME